MTLNNLFWLVSHSFSFPNVLNSFLLTILYQRVFSPRIQLCLHGKLFNLYLAESYNSCYIIQMRYTIAHTSWTDFKASCSSLQLGITWRMREVKEGRRGYNIKTGGIQTAKPLRKANKIISLQIMLRELRRSRVWMWMWMLNGACGKQCIQHAARAECSMLHAPRDARTLNRLCQMIEITS